MLEIRMLFGDVMEASGVGEFFRGQLIEFLLRFTVESLKNTIHAFLWPLHLVSLSPPWGLAALVVLFLLFPRTLKAPLERWLFDEESPGAVADDNTDTEEPK